MTEDYWVVLLLKDFAGLKNTEISNILQISLETAKIRLHLMKSNFNDYQLSSDLLKSISMLSFESPTRVQEEVIPTVLEQKDGSL